MSIRKFFERAKLSVKRKKTALKFNSEPKKMISNNNPIYPITKSDENLHSLPVNVDDTLPNLPPKAPPNTPFHSIWSTIDTDANPDNNGNDDGDVDPIIHDILLGLKYTKKLIHKHSIKFQKRIAKGKKHLKMKDIIQDIKRNDKAKVEDAIKNDRETLVQHCNSYKTLEFPNHGSNATPKHSQKSFTFTIYGDPIFNILQRRFGIEETSLTQPYQFLYEMFNKPFEHDINNPNIFDLHAFNLNINHGCKQFKNFITNR